MEFFASGTFRDGPSPRWRGRSKFLQGHKSFRAGGGERRGLPTRRRRVAAGMGGSAGSLASGGSGAAGGAGGTGGAGGSGGSPVTCDLPSTFSWTSSQPLITPKSPANHNFVSIKDPTIVQYNGSYHVFATVYDQAASWSSVYLTFDDWSEAGSATQIHSTMDVREPGLALDCAGCNQGNAIHRPGQRHLRR